MAGRDPWIDNIKTVLIVIVVIGHSIVLLPSTGLRSHVYDFVYYVHMPAFVLVTGYLSRSFRWSPRHLLSLVTTLAIPYVVFSYLMAWWRTDVTGEVSSLDPILTDPHWPMWYLTATIMWRLATPIFKLHWGMIAVAVALSLWGGTQNIELFDVNRTLGFLPFFVIGLHLPELVLKAARSSWSPVFGAAYALWLWFWMAPRTDHYWSTPWLFFRSPYDAFGVTAAEGMQIRAWLILIGLGGTLALVTLVPRTENRLSSVGAYTLVVYLFHGFPIRWANEAGYADWMPASDLLALLITITLAICWALLLGSRPVASKLMYVADPINSFFPGLTKKKSTPRKASAAGSSTGG